MRRLVAFLLFLLGLVASHAAWAAPSLVEQARAYATAHNLPIREVKLDKVPGREGMVRIFVPVTDQTHDDFVQRFTKTGAIIRQPGDQFGVEHVHVALAPDDVMEYTRLQGGGKVVPPSSGGLYVALALTPEQKAYFKKNSPQASRNGVNGRSVGCMYWLSNGTTGPDQPIGHAFGVKRSSAPSNLVKKLVHAGDEGVIVGVPFSESDQATQNLKVQVTNYERAIDQAQAQIADYEKQGGSRWKLFQSQAAPYHDAVGKADAAIADRQHQPRIVAGLEARKQEIQARFGVMQQQHEAPYHQRIQQLEATVGQTEQRLAQARAARDEQVKVATEALAARRQERAQLVRIAPKPGASSRYEMKLFELDQAMGFARTQMQQGHAAREVSRAQWHAQIKAGEEQLALAAKLAPPAQAHAPNADAFNQRLAQVNQQIAQYEGLMANPQYTAQQKAGWKPALDQFARLRQELTKLGAERYDANIDNQMTQATQNIGNGHAQLVALDVQAEQQNAAFEQQIKGLQAQRDAIAQKGPAAFHPEYDQELERVDQEIARQEAAIAAEKNVPQSAPRVAQLRAALATAVGAKQALLAQKPHEFNPQFHQHLTQLDQQVQNLETQIQQYGNQPQYANYLPQWRAQIAPLQQQKAELLKGGPAAFAKQQYEARVTQLDQQIAGVENNINGYPGANYAPQRAQWKTQLDDFRKIKKAIVAMGPEAYSAEYEQKLTAATQAVSQAKTNVQTTTWNFDAQLAAVQREAKLADALKAELAKHGALRYNPHYEQRLAQLDQQNGQLESYIASPQYGRDQKAQWRAQIAQNEKIRDDLMASGPDNYSPYEPQIQGLRQQIEQHRAAMAPLKQQIEIADAAANKGAAIEDKFAAISDQVLMGAPPGGGVAEAVHKPAAK